MFATFMAQSKFVTGVCVACGILRGEALVLRSANRHRRVYRDAVVRVPFMVISNKARDKRIDERTRRGGCR